MPKTCIVHAGAHKTGSTAIQKALEGYDDGRTVYADLGQPNHSVPIRIAFSDLPQTGPGGMPLPNNAPEHMRQKVEDALAQERACIVFSGEVISTLPSDACRDFRDLILKHCDEIKVVLFVREPLTMTASIAQQKIKRGLLDSLENISNGFRKRYELICEVFGRDCLDVLRYEDKEAYGGDVTRLFAECYGLDPAKMNPLDGFKNPSLPEVTVQALYQMQRVSNLSQMHKVMPEIHLPLLRELRDLVEDQTPLDVARFGSAVDMEDCACANRLIDQPYDLSFSTDTSLEDYMNAPNDALLEQINTRLLSKNIILAPLKTYEDALSMFFTWVCFKFYRNRAAKEKRKACQG